MVAPSGEYFARVSRIYSASCVPAIPLLKTAKSAVVAGETVIYANPALNTTSSPLIYVFQTTLSF